MKEYNGFFEEFGDEIDLAAQEFGIKEGLRLFGISYYFVCPYTVQKKDKPETPEISCFYTDTAYKYLFLYHLAVKETKGKITLTRAKHKDSGRTDIKGAIPIFKYPIKITKTSEFITERTAPINPLYNVLLNRNIIFPFQCVMKKKDWQALPFIEKDFKAEKIK